MRKILKIHLITLTFLASIGISIAITPSTAHAISGNEFKAGRIIDDAIFYSPGAMSVGQIQDFLNAKMPSCDNWGAKPYNGTTRRAYSESKGVSFPLTCLKDYYENTTTRENNLSGNPIPGGAKSAAQIIYDAAQAYSINPQVLIVMLQKEQNLILDDWPWPNQFNKAMGYACPDTAPCDTQFFGFHNQVSNAAKQLRRYATTPQSFNFIAGTTNNIRYNPNAACGSSPVYIENTATASLYNYTPYQPNQSSLDNLYGSGDGCGAYGNRNFWRFFNDWFGTTLVGQYPSPLYKASNSPTIYAVAEGKKYPIPSYHVMVNYGFQKYPVAIVDSSVLDTYPTQSALTSIAKKANDPSGMMYLFDDGKRYPISTNDCKKNPDGSSIANTTWGLDCFNSAVSLSLPNVLVDRYTTQDINLPQVILFDNAAWKIENGKKRRITDGIFVDVLGGWGRVRWMKDINAGQPVGRLLVADNSIVKFNGDPALYLNQNSTLRPIASPEQYNAWNLFKLQYVGLPADYNAPDPIPVGPTMQYCARTGGGENFLISSARSKVSLNGQDIHWDTSNCSTNLDYTLLTIPNMGNTGVYRSETGTIFTVFDKKKLVFPSMDDFYNLGRRPEQIIGVSAATESTLGYGGMHMAAKRLFKVTGDPTIRLTTDSGSLIVNSTNYPGLPYDKLITVDALTGARYPVSGTYQP